MGEITPEFRRKVSYRAVLHCALKFSRTSRERHRQLELMSREAPDILQEEIARLHGQIDLLREYLPEDTNGHR